MYTYGIVDIVDGVMDSLDTDRLCMLIIQAIYTMYLTLSNYKKRYICSYLS